MTKLYRTKAEHYDRINAMENYRACYIIHECLTARTHTKTSKVPVRRDYVDRKPIFCEGYRNMTQLPLGVKYV